MKKDGTLLIKNAMVFDGIHEEPYPADILVSGGKIKKIAKAIRQKADEVFDADKLFAFPGLVDAHSHLGMDGYGIGYEGADYNELNDIISPHLRAIDGFKPLQPSMAQAAQAGVTTVCTGPGSANVLGGTFMAVKTVGRRVEDMIVKKETAMKCAFGENPKRVYRDKADSSRMTTAARLREMLFKAREYLQKKEQAGGDMSKLPAFDMKLEALIPVLKGEMPLKRTLTRPRISSPPSASPGSSAEAHAGACDRRPSDRRGTGKGEPSPGCRPQSD